MQSVFNPCDILLGRILKDVSIQDVLALTQVNTFFADICRDKEVWKQLLLNEYGVHSHWYNPKAHYQFLNSRAKVHICYVNEIPHVYADDEPFDEFFFNNEMAKFYMPVIMHHLRDRKMMHGDIVRLKSDYSHSDMLYSDRQKKLVNLSSHYDTLVIPKEFSVTEEKFHPFYWSEIDNDMVLYMFYPSLSKRVTHNDIKDGHVTVRLGRTNFKLKVDSGGCDNGDSCDCCYMNGAIDANMQTKKMYLFI